MPAASPPPARSARRLGVGAWLGITALAFVVGLAGGLVGAVATTTPTVGTTEAGILEVQRRTAAPLEADNGSVAAVAATMLPSTVQVLVRGANQAGGASGSGWVMDSDGHIITNNHVVAAAATGKNTIQIVDHAGRRFPATLVGRSAVYDLAVLYAKPAKKIPPAVMGSSTQMHVGETVVAVGSPLGLSATVTSGIISALNRPVSTGRGEDSSFINAIQTDAAINPGNSGGPLTDLQGQVIGVNSAIATTGSFLNDEGGNIGVGFAIPIEQVQITTHQILSSGQAQYPVIGADIIATRDRSGARVERVAPDSAAAAAGIRSGDVITAVEGVPVFDSIEVIVAIRVHQPGQTISLTVQRDGKERQLQVTLQAQTG